MSVKMADKIRTVQGRQLTWAASSTISQDFKLRGALTRVVLRLALTPSATLSGAIQEDGIFRVIESIKIKGAGGVTYWELPGEQIGRLIHLLNLADGVLKGSGHGIMAATNDVLFIFHFGSRPYDHNGRANRFDLTGFIPCFDEGGITIDWLTTANTAIDDTVTLSSAIGYVTTYEVLGTAEAIREEMRQQGALQAIEHVLGATAEPLRPGYTPCMVPAMNGVKWAHDADYSALGKEHLVPSGNLLRRIILMVQDGTATRPLRIDTECTKVALKLPVGNQNIIEDDFVAFNYEHTPNQSLLVDDTGTTGGTPVVGMGFAILDLRDHGNPDYGLNLLGKSAGDVKLLQTIANYGGGEDTFIAYDQMRPYQFK